MKITVQQDSTLLDILQLCSPMSSKTTLRSWVKEERVTIDGKIQKIPSTPVKIGQEVVIGSKKKYVEGGLKILFEDDYLVIVDKPEGMLSVSTNFESEETAFASLKEYYHNRKVFAVHRLDQDTSGVMVFALNAETSQKLKKMFELHDIDRQYCAIIEGHLAERCGTWRSYLFEDANYVVHVTDDERKGVLAITHYETVSSSSSYSRLNLRLETGKKNQIRVHCQQAGHPVVGDRKYGSKKNPVKRICLHAHTLSFKHPENGNQMNFHSPIPDSFANLA